MPQALATDFIYFWHFFQDEGAFFWAVWITPLYVIQFYIALQKAYFFCEASPSYDGEAIADYEEAQQEAANEAAAAAEAEAARAANENFLLQ